VPKSSRPALAAPQAMKLPPKPVLFAIYFPCFAKGPINRFISCVGLQYPIQRRASPE
jgi:hypothetical protein